MKRHDVETQGMKVRDHLHTRHHFLRHAHKDWRVWVAVVLMLAMILTYVITNNLSLWPGKRAVQPTPAINGP